MDEFADYMVDTIVEEEYFPIGCDVHVLHENVTLKYNYCGYLSAKFNSQKHYCIVRFTGVNVL